LSVSTLETYRYPLNLFEICKATDEPYNKSAKNFQNWRADAKLLGRKSARSRGLTLKEERNVGESKSFVNTGRFLASLAIAGLLQSGAVARASELYLQCDLQIHINSTGVNRTESHQYYFEDPDRNRTYLDKQWDGQKVEWGTASQDQLYEQTAQNLTLGWIKGDRPYNFVQHMMTIDRNTGHIFRQL
jgi:hypothetical protein